VQSQSLESEDSLLNDGAALELASYTHADSDGFTFEAAPGATVRFEVYLDGTLDARFIYWHGDGAVHAGAPSNPIDLRPAQL